MDYCTNAPCHRKRWGEPSGLNPVWCILRIRAERRRQECITINLIKSQLASSREPPISRVSVYQRRPITKRSKAFTLLLFVVGGGGFEPPKSETSDLQSDAFGHSANRPYDIKFSAAIFKRRVGVSGAGDWNRTRNLLITNQLLCQLSYTSKTA